MCPLFARMPSNVEFMGTDLKGCHKGVVGLTRLFRELRAMRFDAVADMHGVLRTGYLRMLFRACGVKTACIDKGRKGKKQLTNVSGKRLVRQKTSFERYTDVLRTLGISVRPGFRSIFGNGRGDLAWAASVTGGKGTCRWIGIAPFAAHKGKIYPAERMEKVIGILSRMDRCRIFLFGAGNAERETLEKWEKRYNNTCSLAGKLGLDTELIVMSHLDVMISMDSANMHLASMVAVPVLSIWGATHPFAGFMGWNQPAGNAIQAEMPCRPCSVYGDKPCMRKDYACMSMIEPERVAEHVKQLIDKDNMV